MVNKQEAIDTATEATPAAEPAKRGIKKKAAEEPVEKPEVKPEQLISLAEYRVLTERDISYVLTQGFRVWMKVDKAEPLRTRKFADWDKLFEEYLKS